MIPLLAATAVASKLVDGAASVWKHAASGSHGSANKSQQPGSFQSLLSGQGSDPTAGARDLTATLLAGVSGGSANAATSTSHGSAGGTGQVDRIA